MSKSTLPRFALPHCSHAGCHCQADGENAVVRNGKSYCSKGCADGVGCNHPGCSCNKTHAH
ncbi:MAG: hypothetical protein KF774_15585 [Planctomyces sp.]|nr:hypothetical protein [Planctomyces sp.]